MYAHVFRSFPTEEQYPPRVPVNFCARDLGWVCIDRAIDGEIYWTVPATEIDEAGLTEFWFWLVVRSRLPGFGPWTSF